MGKKNLDYWDEEMIFAPKEIAKKAQSRFPNWKKPSDEEDASSKYDDDDDESYERLPLSQEYLNRIADILDQFLSMVKVYFIYPELPQDEYAAAKKRLKKAIKRMRNGNTKDFDYDRTMEAITNGDIPEKYIDGGY